MNKKLAILIFVWVSSICIPFSVWNMISWGSSDLSNSHAVSSQKQILNSVDLESPFLNPTVLISQITESSVIENSKPSLLEHPLNAKRYAESLNKLGKQEIVHENLTTFLFFNGQYIPQPYTITRNGYSLTLNGKKLIQIPVFPPGYTEEMPELPNFIKQNTSWKDIDEKMGISPTTDWRYGQADWFRQHFPPQEAKKRFVEHIRKLPFVNKVSWKQHFPKEYLHVVSYSGDARDYFSSWWIPNAKNSTQHEPLASGFIELDYLVPFSEGRLQWVRKLQERTIKHFEKIILSGDIFIVNDQGLGTLYIKDSSPQWMNIANVISILKSNASPKLKCSEIYSLVVNKSDFVENKLIRQKTNDWKLIKELVKNFKENPQLDQRIAKIRDKYNIPEWKQPADVPEIKIPERFKKDPRFTPEGSIREAYRLLEAKDYRKLVDEYLVQSENGSKITVESFAKGKYKNRLLIMLKRSQGKKPVIDEIDQTGYFEFYDPKISPPPKGFTKLGIRKMGAFWKIEH